MQSLAGTRLCACYEQDVLGHRDLRTVETVDSPASPGSHVVVFDFDGTLVRRDSFFDFSLRYCLRRPERLLLVITLLPVALLASLSSTGAGGSVLLWAMTVGSSTRCFALALRSYARQTLPGYANPAIFAELARHLREGSRVVIATGTMPIVVRTLLGTRQVERLPIVGSRLRRRFGGLVAETHCIGRVKVRELERRHGIVAWHSVYTDSFADRALLRRARDVHLVATSRRTLLRTRSLLGPDVSLCVRRAG